MTGIATAEVAADAGKNIPEDRAALAEPPEQMPPRAYRVKGFCKAFGVGKTYTHSLIAQGVLKTRYAGAALLITGDSAESWFASLPDQPPRKRPSPPKERVAELQNGAPLGKGAHRNSFC